MPPEDAFAIRLERRGLVELDDTRFTLAPAEALLLSPAASDGRAKNISLGPGGGVRGAAAEVMPELSRLLGRYADWADAAVRRLAPRYAAGLRRGRTSLRTRAVEQGAISPRKDDRRLHVDAFASQPTGGHRILRVFSNINAEGEPRLWNIGEPFADHAGRWVAGLRPPLPGQAWLLQRLGVTRSRRTAYDALMLGLHDAAKLDDAYQAAAPRRERAFAAGAGWMVFTDSTVHAAIRGRYVLEQTFYLPPAAMAAPDASPLAILTRMTGRTLV